MLFVHLLALDKKVNSKPLHLALSFALIFACLGLPNTAVAPAVEEHKQEESIGLATMKDDGTIVLRLRGKLPKGGTGEGTLVYPPTHPEYQKILSHIGPLCKGQTVPVKPWPD
jgi:hypothetical protein